MATARKKTTARKKPATKKKAAAKKVCINVNRKEGLKIDGTLKKGWKYLNGKPVKAKAKPAPAKKRKAKPKKK